MEGTCSRHSQLHYVPKKLLNCNTPAKKESVDSCKKKASSLWHLLLMIFQFDNSAQDFMGVPLQDLRISLEIVIGHFPEISILLVDKISLKGRASWVPSIIWTGYCKNQVPILPQKYKTKGQHILFTSPSIDTKISIVN